MLKSCTFSPPLLPHIPHAPTPIWYLERKAIKYPRITIKSDLSIFVRVPFHLQHEAIDCFVNQHYKWICNTLHKLAQRTQLLHNIIDSHAHEILLFGSWRPLNSIQSYPSYKTVLKNFLLNYIVPRTNTLSKQMNLSFNALTITHATSRFGSCTHDNRLFFSLMLVFASPNLIDYVIIHELAHIRHKNHSKSFWQLVQKHCKDAQILRAKLKEEAAIYPLLLKRI